MTWLNWLCLIVGAACGVGLAMTAFSMAPEMAVELQAKRRMQWAKFRRWLARKVGG